jgi:hypothetical protein
VIRAVWSAVNESNPAIGFAPQRIKNAAVALSGSVGRVASDASPSETQGEQLKKLRMTEKRKT